MEKKLWLRGLAVSLSVSGLSGIAFGQHYGTVAGGGLAPSSYPIPNTPLYRDYPQQPTFNGSGYPYLAQNALLPIEGQVHLPTGNYSVPGSVPNPNSALVSGDPQALIPQAFPSPLPPVQGSSLEQSGSQIIGPSAAPMYQVPVQQPIAAQSPPMPQASQSIETVPTVAPSAGCQTCNQPMSQLWSGYNSAQCASSCLTGRVAPKPWIFGANALIFNRIDDDYIRLTSNTVNSGPAVLSTFNSQMETAGGVELFGGRYFGCGKYALIGSYWGLFPEDQTSIVYDPELDTSAGDTLRSNLPFTVLGPAAGPSTLHGIEMPGGADVPGPNGGQNAYDWYDNAYAHRLIRTQEYNNVEVNIFSFALGGAARNGVAACGASCESCGPAACAGCTGVCAPITGAQCSRLRFSWLGGLRWFRFDDYMEYATSENDAAFGGADDFYYRNTLQNDLVGFQLGGRATYCTGCRVNLYGGTKFGVFGNQINYDTFAGTTTTAAIVSSYNSYDNQAYDIHTSTTELSLLGEGELGMGIRLSDCWTANCGYRVIGATGIATAPGQIPYDFSLLNDVQRVHHNESLVLHGVSFGAMYNW